MKRVEVEVRDAGHLLEVGDAMTGRDFRDTPELIGEVQRAIGGRTRHRDGYRERMRVLFDDAASGGDHLDAGGRVM